MDYLAFSFGLPIIAPTTGLFGDIVKHEKNGFLYNPSEPKSLQNIIETAYYLTGNENQDLMDTIYKYNQEIDWRTTAAILSNKILSII